MEKTYNPHAIEQHWYQVWENQGYFAPRGQGEPYCIMIPPPNVTGTLHMGHAFQDTLMDALVRYYRMKGNKTLWQPGTDHAGIATQMVIERQLESEGQSRHDLGKPLSNAYGIGNTTLEALSPHNCGVWAPRWTGGVSALLWMMTSRVQCAKYLFDSMTKD